MTSSPTAPPALSDLRRLTPARVALGRAGVSLTTDALLDFTLAHARARDAVHAAFDAAAVAAELGALGLTPLQVSSRAQSRRDYLARPDLGRQLDPASRAMLEAHPSTADLALVIGDGLSPVAVAAQAGEVVRRLLPRLAASGIGVGPAAVVTGARVALGDEIGALLGARIVLVLIGERPGLSAPASLGAYVTLGPRPGRTDADRNCVSNIHAAGISPDEAAFKIAWLVRESMARGASGVALKDESGEGGSTPAELPGPG
ncbi:Ethanolamine ammonia-lyase light chain [Rhodopseudomonas palustris HaA2]|uniref:Ethanolamine ammonia-lyase small subunit n=1 Tax=Rhodopseudomonas palustris (strain HaA2) TaxID=316058 RepID=Q2IZD3_RHOP2|nr:ethanolamine ammonia-lyase subunit EutC [Rhodopseudomonas palustris]ABD06427.1 Ethanolamine ammonia-lyase light chain [Rhodopseudomonas palustris HaA2]